MSGNCYVGKIVSEKCRQTLIMTRVVLFLNSNLKMLEFSDKKLMSDILATVALWDEFDTGVISESENIEGGREEEIVLFCPVYDFRIEYRFNNSADTRHECDCLKLIRFLF